MDKPIKHKIIDLDNKSKENIDLPSFIFSTEIKLTIWLAMDMSFKKFWPNFFLGFTVFKLDYYLFQFSNNQSIILNPV